VVSGNSLLAIVGFLSLSLFGFFGTPTGSKGAPILMIYAWYDVFSPLKNVLGGFVNIAPHLGGHIPPKNYFRDVNRRFQGKRAE